MTSRARRSRSGRNVAKEDSREDRVSYDMQQALAMRGQAAACAARARPSSSLSPASSPTSDGAPRTTATSTITAPSPTADDANLALRGLDSAEELEQRGDLAEALKIYELSISALIKFINASPRGGGGGGGGGGSGLDREAVAERVRAALTEAERIKAEISNGRKINGNDGGDGDIGQQEWSVGGYLSSALAGWGSRENSSRSVGSQAASEEEDAGRRKQNKKTSTDADADPDAATATTADKRRSSPRHAAASSSPRRTSRSPTGTSADKRTSSPRHAAAASSSPRRKSRSPTSATSTTSPTNVTTARTAAKGRPQRRKRSNLDYTNDPLVKTIKDDLYVDSVNIKVKWDDISGLDDAKRSLQEAAILPLLRPDLYTGLRSPPKGILLYGPPGTGKTMLVKAVAHESKCILFACTASAMTSKWHGEGEKLVRTLFRMAADVAPSILFFDEIDALLSSRKAEGEHEASRRFKTEFMVQMDGVASSGGGADGEGDDVQHRVLIIGCTNTPWDIDDAVMRRFQRRIYIPLPDADARGTLLRNMLKKANDHSITSRQVSQLVKLTEGYSCSDISSIAQEASFGPLRSLGGMEQIRDAKSQDVRPINIDDFKDAIAKSKKSVTSGLLAKYDAWEREQMAGGI